MYDSIIVGAGPAGMTAALYLLRSGKSVLLIEAESFGGQIASAPNIENYPGIPKMDGSDFADKLLSQVTDAGAEIEVSRVLEIKPEKKDGMDSNHDYFTVVTEFGSFQSKTVILACGVHHRTLGIENEAKYFSKGISFCAICDGPFYKGKTATVVGGGNSAVQEAIYLSDICSKVYLIHRRDEFRAEKSTMDKIKQLENVEIITDSVIVDFYGDDKLNGLLVKNIKTSAEKKIDTDVLFEAIGKVPQNTFFANIVALTEDGYIISDDKCATSCPGIFAAGDCRAKNVRQLTTAVSDGSIAALSAVDYM